MLKLNPGQRRASKLLTGPQRHTCLVGGSRSGKTTIIVKANLVRGFHAPESRHVILRQRANAARISIALDTLPKVMRACYPHVTLIPHVQDGYFELPNGSELWIGGLDDEARVDKILGREFATMSFNECSEIPYGSVTTALTRLAQVCKCGDDSRLPQRALYDLNPVGKMHWTNVQFGDKLDPMSRQPLAKPEDFVRLFMNPEDNAENLDAAYIESLRNMPERQRKRFYEGLYVDELEGALWSLEGIDRGRVEELPEDRRRRVVVAVDPSGARSMMDNERDEIGIIVAALGTDGHGYVLEDLSLRDSPGAWARVAVTAYHRWRADCIVAEVNFGGAMVESTIKSADPNVPVRVVTASRGKAIRAEPIAAFYGEPPEFKKIMVHHVGRFPVLEDQLVAFTTAGYRGEGSPDHADAAIWAFTELMLEGDAEAWISYYAKLAAATKEAAAVKPPDRPVPEDAEQEAEVTNSVADVYRRITGAAIDKQKTVCAWCGEAVGSSRATDGVDVYHDETDKPCFRMMMRAGKRMEAVDG